MAAGEQRERRHVEVQRDAACGDAPSAELATVPRGREILPPKRRLRLEREPSGRSLCGRRGAHEKSDPEP